MDSKIIKKIVEAAVRAPSGDNVQPWKLELSSDFLSLEIHNLPELDNSYYNFRQAAAYVAHGALIENIIIASRHLGCRADIRLFPDRTNPNHVASIRFQESEAEFDPLYEAIFTRYTNRFPFKYCPIGADDRGRLLDAIQSVEGINACLIDDRTLINKLAKMLMINDRLVFERSDIHRFLFNQIRWSQEQVDSSLDGMPLDVLGLSGVEKVFFPLMRFWGFVRIANYFGLSRIIALKCWNNLRSSALIGHIVVKKYDAQDFVNAGRAMQRVWLEATRQGLAFQPIIGLPLLIYREKLGVLADFSESQRCMISDIDVIWRRLCCIPNSDKIAIGFRIGKGRLTPIKTKRRLVDSQ